jgi:hypothetical protein
MTGLSAADIERARAYLRDDCQLPIEEIVVRIDAAHARLAESALELSPADLDRAVNGGWSPREVLSHVVEWTVRASQQVLYIALSGELPPPTDIALPGAAQELLVRQREALDSLYAHVREADPTAFLEFTWDHPIFGPLNWREWLLFLELHYIDHARQIGAARG